MNSNIYQFVIDTVIGKLAVRIDDNHVQSVELFAEQAENTGSPSALTELASQQLQSYFEQAHNDWSLPLALKGTEFQRKVWQYLQSIPMGETRSYSEAAQALNTSARAIGNACRANSFTIVIPCHRIVSKTGLGGFYGKTDGDELTIKQWLLNHEQC